MGVARRHDLVVLAKQDERRGGDGRQPLLERRRLRQQPQTDGQLRLTPGARIKVREPGTARSIEKAAPAGTADTAAAR